MAVNGIDVSVVDSATRLDVPDPVTLVGVPELLADAGRRIRAVAEHEPAGSLAVIEVRVPAGTAPEAVAVVFDLVAATASHLGARVAFDDDQGHYLLLPASDARTARSRSRRAGSGCSAGWPRSRWAVPAAPSGPRSGPAW